MKKFSRSRLQISMGHGNSNRLLFGSAVLFNASRSLLILNFCTLPSDNTTLPSLPCCELSIQAALPFVAVPVLTAFGA